MKLKCDFVVHFEGKRHFNVNYTKTLEDIFMRLKQNIKTI